MYKGNLLRDTILLMFTRILTVIVNLGQVMILSRMLSKESYGAFSQGLLVITLGTQVLSMGFENAITFFYNRSQRDSEKKMYVGLIFKMSLLVNLVGGILIMGLSSYISDYFHNPILKKFIIYISFRPLLSNLISLYNSLYVSCGLARNNAIRSVIFSLLRIVLLPMALILNNNVKTIFIVLLVLDIIQVIYLMCFFAKKYFYVNIFHKEDNKLIKTIFLYSYPLFLNTIVGTLSKEMDKLIVGRMFSLKEFAIYSNVSKELPFSFFAFTLSTLLLPILVQKIRIKKMKEVIEIWKIYLELGIIFIGMSVTASIINSKELLLLLYSEKYMDGLLIFQIYLVMEYFRFSYFGIILSSYGKNVYILFCSIGALIGNAILNIILIQYMGIAGPAIASVITIAIVNGLQIKNSCRILQVKMANVFNLKFLFTFSIKLIVVSILCYQTKVFLLHLQLNYILQMIIVYCLFFVIIGILEFRNIKKLIYELKIRCEVER